MNKPVGGRGKLAPYISTHVRIPEDIKSHVELLKQMYYEGKLKDIKSFEHCLLEDYEAISKTNQQLEEKLTQQNETIECQKQWIETIVSNPSANSLPTLQQAHDYADKLIGQKKSARICLVKLIDFIYGKDR